MMGLRKKENSEYYERKKSINFTYVLFFGNKKINIYKGFSHFNFSLSLSLISLAIYN